MLYCESGINYKTKMGRVVDEKGPIEDWPKAPPELSMADCPPVGSPGYSDFVLYQAPVLLKGEKLEPQDKNALPCLDLCADVDHNHWLSKLLDPPADGTIQATDRWIYGETGVPPWGA